MKGRARTMYDDDNGFDLFVGLILWAPLLAWFWIKCTFVILEFVFGVLAAIVTFLYYVIKELFDFISNLVSGEKS